MWWTERNFRCRKRNKTKIVDTPSKMIWFRAGTLCSKVVFFWGTVRRFPCLCLFRWLVVHLTVKVMRLSLAIQRCMVILVSRLIFGCLQSVCMDEKCSVQSRSGLFSPSLRNNTTQQELSKITQTSNKTWICCFTLHTQKKARSEKYLYSCLCNTHSKAKINVWFLPATFICSSLDYVKAYLLSLWSPLVPSEKGITCSIQSYMYYIYCVHLYQLLSRLQQDIIK